MKDAAGRVTLLELSEGCLRRGNIVPTCVLQFFLKVSSSISPAPSSTSIRVARVMT